MPCKIKVSNTSEVTLEFKERNGELLLHIYKTFSSERGVGIDKESALVFNADQATQLNAIVQMIDSGNYAIKEYGKLHKGARIFKIFMSSFRGKNSLQVRERLVSPTYTGYGKQGATFPSHKIKEFQDHLIKLMDELVVG